MTVRWPLHDIGPTEVAAKLQPACGGVPASGEMLQALDVKWRTEPDATSVVWSLLGGWNRLACVFYKTVETPVDHDETVRELVRSLARNLSLTRSFKQPNPMGISACCWCTRAPVIPFRCRIMADGATFARSSTDLTTSLVASTSQSDLLSSTPELATSPWSRLRARTYSCPSRVNSASGLGGLRSPT